MALQKTRYLKFDALQQWWPRTVEEVVSLLDQSPIVILWQCPESLASECQRWVFRQRPFFAPLIDLRRSEDELWQKLDPQTCRGRIRKGQKMECVILRNEQLEAARAFINDSIRRQSYRPELTQSEWETILPTHDVFMCLWEGVPVVVHVFMRAPPGRAKLVLSGTADRADPRFNKVVGPLNRLLHWHEVLLYKAEGYQVYDLGGSTLDKNSPEYPITQFKLSFGAELAAEPILFLAKNPALRGLLRGIGLAQRAVRAIPWPQSWLAAVRANPKLAFFRQ